MQFIRIHWGTRGPNGQMRYIYICIYRCNAIIESIELRKIRSPPDLSRECLDKLMRGFVSRRFEEGYPLDREFWISISIVRAPPLSFLSSIYTTVIRFEQIFFFSKHFSAPFSPSSPSLFVWCLRGLSNFARDRVLYSAIVFFSARSERLEWLDREAKRFFYVAFLFLFFYSIYEIANAHIVAKHWQSVFSLNTREKNSWISTCLATSRYHSEIFVQIFIHPVTLLLSALLIDWTD